MVGQPITPVANEHGQSLQTCRTGTVRPRHRLTSHGIPKTFLTQGIGSVVQQWCRVVQQARVAKLQHLTVNPSVVRHQQSREWRVHDEHGNITHHVVADFVGSQLKQRPSHCGIALGIGHHDFRRNKVLAVFLAVEGHHGGAFHLFGRVQGTHQVSVQLGRHQILIVECGVVQNETIRGRVGTIARGAILDPRQRGSHEVHNQEQRKQTGRDEHRPPRTRGQGQFGRRGGSFRHDRILGGQPKRRTGRPKAARSKVKGFRFWSVRIRR